MKEDKLPMRSALAMFYPPEKERLRFARQIGVEDIIIWGNTFCRQEDEEKELSVAKLRELREMVEEEGLRLFGIENLPWHFYDRIFWGKEGKEEQLHHYRNSIRNMAEAGVYNLGYNWIPYGVKRTTYSYPIRGGAKGTAYDHKEMCDIPLIYDREYSEEEFWDNYAYFIKGILPVAEEAGVTISCHPNDPPVDAIGGVPHLFKSVAAYDRAFELYPSENHKVTLCLGNLEEMGGDLYEMIRHFGEMDKIHYVHFQSVSGSIPEFHEEFIDTGDYDPYEIIKVLKECGFHGVMIPGHVPQIEGDVEWRTEESNKHTSYHHPMGGYRARAYTIGYMRALIHAVTKGDEE